MLGYRTCSLFWPQNWLSWCKWIRECSLGYASRSDLLSNSLVTSVSLHIHWVSFLTCKAVESSVCSGLPNPETKFHDSNGKHICALLVYKLATPAAPGRGGSCSFLQTSPLPSRGVEGIILPPCLCCSWNEGCAELEEFLLLAAAACAASSKVMCNYSETAGKGLEVKGGRI